MRPGSGGAKASFADCGGNHEARQLFAYLVRGHSCETSGAVVVTADKKTKVILREPKRLKNPVAFTSDVQILLAIISNPTGSFEWLRLPQDDL